MGVHKGNDSDFHYVWEKAGETIDSSLMVDLYTALTCSKDTFLLNCLLDNRLAKSDDILQTLIRIITRPMGFVTSWNFLKANWQQIYSRFVIETKNKSLLKYINLFGIFKFWNKVQCVN